MLNGDTPPTCLCLLQFNKAAVMFGIWEKLKRDRIMQSRTQWLVCNITDFTTETQTLQSVVTSIHNLNPLHWYWFCDWHWLYFTFYSHQALIFWKMDATFNKLSLWHPLDSTFVSFHTDFLHPKDQVVLSVLFGRLWITLQTPHSSIHAFQQTQTK